MLAAPTEKPRPAAGESGQKRILLAPFWGPQGLFESRVVKSLLGSDEDISIVVDTDWRQYYVDPNDHPIGEAENVVFDDNRQVIEIGKILRGDNDVDGEFIGMMKLTHAGARSLNATSTRSRKNIGAGPSRGRRPSKRPT